MNDRYDVVVVGSGFGGAITAARLAEGGARVLVLERGRRWTPETYPRTVTDPWIYGNGRPHKQNGWLDLRFYRGMIVIQGAGVGGGSLCYSSVVMEADPDLFDGDWPEQIDYAEMRPYYDRVGKMLGVRPIPDGQTTMRARLLREAATKLGYEDRYSSVPLAIAFDEDWNYDLADPLNPSHSKSFVNEFGQEQGTCIHLGNCDIGCDVRAKNTLDVNYIPLAEQHGAEVRPLHIVRRIEQDGDGYRVVFDRIEADGVVPGSERAGRVVVAAGSIGSTELLLRCRDEYGTLPRVGPMLGKGWSPNANFLTPDRYRDGNRVRQGIGPTITAGLDFMDGSVENERFYIEDDGFPNLIYNALSSDSGSRILRPLAWLLRRDLSRGLDEGNLTRSLMLWLGEGMDAANGELKMRRRRFRRWKKDVSLDWNVKDSRGVADAILGMHRQLSEAAGGRLHVPITWRLLKGMVTVHPLGGARMGDSIMEGVVDQKGEVFNYPGLFVIDGAMVPTSIGRNPSMTIAALAERSADLMLRS